MVRSSSKFRSTAIIAAVLLGAMHVPAALASSLPSPPTTLGVSGPITQNNLTLIWNPPDSLGGATGVRYELFHNGSKFASSSTPRFTVGYLKAGTAYLFSVRACTAKGCSKQSASISVITVPASPPAPLGKAGNTQMMLTWRASQGADAHRVLYRLKTDTAFSEWTPGQADASPTTLTGLTNGASYVFKVQAYNTSGSADSNLLTATPQTVPDTPSAPERVTASPTMTAFRWVRPADGGSPLRGYELWVNGTMKLHLGPNTTSSTIRNASNTQAEVQLKACNVLGCSPLSSPLWVGTPPDPPTALSAIGDIKAVTITWTPSLSVGVLSHRVSFRVYGSTRDADWLELTPGVADTSPATITNLSDGTRYEVRVTAHRSVGYTRSASVTALTAPTPPTTTPPTTTSPPPTTSPPTTTPVSTVAAVMTTGHHHTCARFSTGAVKCWGENTNGQLGDGTTTNRTTPTQVSGLSSGVQQLSSNENSNCVVLTTGAVKCWGQNTYGQLGDGAVANRSVPTQVAGLTSGVIQVAVGVRHACALFTSGAVKCWGNNVAGQLGDGTTTGRAAPTQVSGLNAGVVQITAGNSHTCAKLSTGALVCWGQNAYGQLGDGTSTTRTTPTAVPGLTSLVTQVSAGDYHTCAVLDTGSATCWGYNLYGQLGNGTTTQSTTPVAVSGLSTGVVQISAAESHTCAVTAAGSVKCWGWNASFGQLGDGTYTNRSSPVQVTGITTGAASVSAGSHHTCALLADGTAKCWGCNNGRGQLGDGTTTGRNTPVTVGGLNAT